MTSTGDPSTGGPSSGDGPTGPRTRRHDRRGRGVRGPLAWPEVPAMATRRQQFDDLVLDSAARLEARLGPQFSQVEFAVEDVPATDPAPWERQGIPLGRTFPGRGKAPARVVVYRRPVESRAQDQRELSAIVQDVVVEQVAALFNIPPSDLDPRYDDQA